MQKFLELLDNVIFRGRKNPAKPQLVKVANKRPPIRHVLSEDKRQEYQKLLESEYPHRIFFGPEYGLPKDVIAAEQDSD